MNARVSIENAIPVLIRLIGDIRSLRGTQRIDLASDDTLQYAPRLQHLTPSQVQMAPLRVACRPWSVKANSALGALRWSLKQEDVSRRSEGIDRVKSTLQVRLVVDHTRILLKTRTATQSSAQSVKTLKLC
jgi:hypothetical protein